LASASFPRRLGAALDPLAKDELRAAIKKDKSHIEKNQGDIRCQRENIFHHFVILGGFLDLDCLEHHDVDVIYVLDSIAVKA
jgi:hypothetical protein